VEFAALCCILQQKRTTVATRSITAHLPVELVQKLDQYAERLERSRGWIVKEAVDDWVEREAEHDRLTREALASVEAGRLVDNGRVEAWLDSLGSPNPKPLPRP
jgi:predicted transcriptional regulator